MSKAEVVRNIDDKIVRYTISISRDSYPVGRACGNPEEYYNQMLTKQHNIHIMLSDNEKKSASFLRSLTTTLWSN